MPEGEPPVIPEEDLEKYLDSLVWQEDANCVNKDRDMFFPGKNENTVAAEAKAVCKGCDKKVAWACLEYAVRDPKTLGIWGGTSERERLKIRKQRNADASDEQAIQEESGLDYLES